MRTAGTRAVCSQPHRLGARPGQTACSLRKVVEALGGGSGGGLVARTRELWAPRSSKAERGRGPVWLSPGSAEPAWRPSSLSHSACRTPSGASLWLSLGWDTGPAVTQTF